MDGTRGLRPLLPTAPAAGDSTATRPQPPVNAGRGRVHTLNACEACHRRKTKCSGDRPRCLECTKRQLACVYDGNPFETASQSLKRKYDDVQERLSAHEELLGLLRDLPDAEATAVLQKVRSGADAAYLVRHIKSGNLLLQMALTPETRLRYDFPYATEMPSSLLSDNPYLNSLIYEAAALYSGSQQPPSLSEAAPAFPGGFSPSQDRSLYLKPFHAAEFIDPRLSAARPSIWTTVSSDDALMRDLLGVLFRSEFSFPAPFQKDYFLEDMAAQKREFCSPLLVNTVLAYACCCYSRFRDRAEYWNPQTLVYQFRAESKRLWELESLKQPEITTVQAAMVLNLIYNMSSLDKLGRVYGIQAVALAHELRLYDPLPTSGSKRSRDGWAFTSWALYNFETLVAYHYMHPPLLKHPPPMQPPDPSQDPQWFGDFWVKYPLTTAMSSIYFGHLFRARCQFRVIMNEISFATFEDGAEMTLDQARTFYIRLKSWHDDLPWCLKPKFIIHPAHFQLHLHYQNLLLTLYEPFASEAGDDAFRPEKIISDARKYFQTLIRIYYLRHGFEATDVFICQPLTLAGFMCLRAVNDSSLSNDELEATRSTLFLVAKGLRDQSRNYHLAGTLLRAIQGGMRPEESSLMKDLVSSTGDLSLGEETLKQAVQSAWPVSIVSKLDNLESNRLNRLIEQLSHANMEEGEGVVQEGNRETPS